MSLQVKTEWSGEAGFLLQVAKPKELSNLFGCAVNVGADMFNIMHRKTILLFSLAGLLTHAACGLAVELIVTPYQQLNDSLGGNTGHYSQDTCAPEFDTGP